MSQKSNQLSGAPPSYEEASKQGKQSDRGDPPPYHNWQDAVPDTSTFPPPPVSAYYSSGTGNASSDDAERAHAFCNNTPLYIPTRPSLAVYTAVQHNDLRPVRANEYGGKLLLTSQGKWYGHTADRNGDCLVTTHLPLYFAAEDSPFIRETRKTVYFEVKLLARHACSGTGNADESGFAIGFVAQPYPSWRSPGWERGSLGIFSDDGCRFVNDSWGGRDFASPFNVGETVGIGMVFALPGFSGDAKQGKNQGKGQGKEGLGMGQGTKRVCKVEVFFTRNGRRVGGWDLHEEVDENSGGIGGLEGDYDLYGAIGLFGGVEFEACFDPAGWLWRPAV
ncbi:hypothetical protein N7466_005249 [Penicillium verhagenii]|uniref:uncharacterized protein n=1 Tax=Penicillium verhagenii TaxID=1562060 RepID=UPI002545420B|nr:uncharacterized protein N7466_005249 [Penicillium verhagenii]KAJ5935702.1 hypothetical protein N7466_005249 [Penicillium verhagenii]